MGVVAVEAGSSRITHRNPAAAWNGRPASALRRPSSDAGHPQKASIPRNTPKMRTMRKMASARKNRTFAMDFAPEATPVNPKKPATSEMTKKMMAHLSTDCSFVVFLQAVRRAGFVSRSRLRKGAVKTFTLTSIDFLSPTQRNSDWGPETEPTFRWARCLLAWRRVSL
jgi:hypothetical protein